MTDSDQRGWLCRWMQENGVGIIGWPHGEKLYVCQRCGYEALR